MRMMKNLFKTMLSVALFTCAAISVQAQNWQWSTPEAGSFYIYNPYHKVYLKATSTVTANEGEATLFTLSAANDCTIAYEDNGTKYVYESEGNATWGNTNTNKWTIKTNNGGYCIYHKDPGYKPIFGSSRNRYISYNGSGINYPYQKFDNNGRTWVFRKEGEVAAYNAYVAAWNALNKKYQRNKDLYGFTSTDIETALATTASMSSNNTATLQSLVNTLPNPNLSCTNRTSLISNPDFNAGNTNGWITDNFNVKSGDKRMDGTAFAEMWSNGGTPDYTSGKISQTISNLPAGSYILKATGWGGFSSTPDRLYAKTSSNTFATDVPGIDGDPVQNFSVAFSIATDQDVEIGFERTNATWWSAVDNFELWQIEDVAVLSVKAEKYGTFVAPFAVTLPNDVDAYTAQVEGNIVHLSQEGPYLPANTPVIVSNLTNVNISTSFYGIATPETSCTDDVLTGVFTATPVPVGAYVLQTQNDVQKFYIVENGKQPTLSPNKCYLNAHAGVKAIGFEGDATAVETIEALTSGSAKIYDLNGRQLHKLQKGINIINGKKVLVK